MFRLGTGWVLALPLFAVAESAVERSFPEANCGFTLPGKDWEWLDPKKAPTAGTAAIAYARNRTGVTFWLKVYPIAAGTAVGPGSYENWERQNAGKYNWTPVSSKHFEFKGVPAYQVDYRHTDNKSSGRFVIVFADNRKYVLGMQTSHAGAGPEADAVFDKFAFLNPPNPMMDRHEDKPPVDEGKTEDPLGDQVNAATGRVGNSAAGLGGLGMFVLILFGAWMLIRRRG
jgi:hypothetical protein